MNPGYIYCRMNVRGRGIYVRMCPMVFGSVRRMGHDEWCMIFMSPKTVDRKIRKLHILGHKVSI